jgi:hypothetical protein
MMKLDWLGMKSFWLNVFLRVLIPIGLIVFGQPLFVILLMAYLMLDSANYTFVTEEKGKLNHLYMTLPVNRKIIVRSRFALILIFLSIGIAVGTVLTLISSTLLYGRTIIFEHTFNPDFNTMLLLICSSVLYCGIVNLFMLPMLLKLGYSKGKFIGYYLPPFGMATLLAIALILITRIEAFRETVFSIFEWGLTNIALTSTILLGAAVVLFVVSYVLSQRVYAKREF